MTLMKEQIKKLLRRLLGWYVEPVYKENERLHEQLERLSGQIADMRMDMAGHVATREKRFDELLSGTSQTEKRLDEVDERISKLEEHEARTRGRFEEQGAQLDRLQQTVSRLQMSDGSEPALLSYSQSGEDAIAAYVLRFLGKAPGEVTYLDLGANHAKELSNTYCFYRLGARGVLVEANPELIPELVRTRPDDIVLNAVVGERSGETLDFYVLNGDGLSTVSLEDAQKACQLNPELTIKAKYEVESCTANEILEKHFTAAPDILSVDLEGLDETILRSIDYERYSPGIIILENIPYTPLLSVDQREYGCVDFLHGKGYTEYAFTGINSIFVLKKIVEEFNERRKKELAGGVSSDNE